MSNFEKGGQVSLAREKDPLMWPGIRTANVFREPYPGWGADRVCRGLPMEWFDVDFDPAERTREDYLADLETGERVCLDCPLAVECRNQAVECKARGLFGAVVTTETGKTWPVDVWVRLKAGNPNRRRKREAGPVARSCALKECSKEFTVSNPNQKYCSPDCVRAGEKAGRRARKSDRARTSLALAS